MSNEEKLATIKDYSYSQAHYPGSTMNILIAIAFQRDAAVLYRMARSHGGQHALAFQRNAATVSLMARQTMEIEL